MAKLDLTKYGITGATEIIHNPSYEVLFAYIIQDIILKKYVNNAFHIANSALYYK